MLFHDEVVTAVVIVVVAVVETFFPMPYILSSKRSLDGRGRVTAEMEQERTKWEVE